MLFVKIIKLRCKKQRDLSQLYGNWMLIRKAYIQQWVCLHDEKIVMAFLIAEHPGFHKGYMTFSIETSLSTEKSTITNHNESVDDSRIVKYSNVWLTQISY